MVAYAQRSNHSPCRVCGLNFEQGALRSVRNLPKPTNPHLIPTSVY
jgi:hypothetical protein